MPKQKIFQILIAVLILGFSSQGFAQLRINSPYSRYGIGDLSTNTGAYYSSMGNMKYSLSSDNHINRSNAASYSGIDSGSFLFEVGLRGLMVNNMTESSSGGSNYFNLDYIKMAFPVTEWWRSSVGLMPFSMVGYDVNLSTTVDSIGEVNYSYLGDGGVNQVYFGNAFKINSSLSVGFNAAYLFGGINTRRISSFPDIEYAYDYRIVNTNNISTQGFLPYVDFGLQYHKTFTRKGSKFEGKTFSFGLSLTPQQKLKFNRTALAYSFTQSTTGLELIKDTLHDDIVDNGKLTMPLILGGGLSYGKKDKWLIGIDATYSMWEDFNINGVSDSLGNSLSLNFGGEYYVNNLALRFGARYEQGNLNFNGNQIDDLGISFGVGIPLRKYKKSRTSSIANLDLGIEIGQRGTINAGLVKQQYVKMYMTLGIQNTWFQKIKYQ